MTAQVVRPKRALNSAGGTSRFPEKIEEDRGIPA